MATGKKEDLPYESDKLGLTILCRMSVDEAGVYSTPSSAVEAPVHAFNGGSRRKFGIHARGLILKRSVTVTDNSNTGPDASLTKDFYTFVPSGTLAAWGAAAVGSSVTLRGYTWLVSGKQEETLR